LNWYVGVTLACKVNEKVGIKVAMVLL